MKTSRHPEKMPARLSSKLPESLQRRLNHYALAVSTAGVGALSVAQPAAAKIVYTPANQQIPWGFDNGLFLDLNHDGINDFFFTNFFSATSSTLELSISPVNKMNEILSTGKGFAAALRAGTEIGPKGKFHPRPGDGMVVGYSFRKGNCVGPWAHIHNRYLGLRFQINGKTHFGWARLNVNCVFPRPIHATLTGYAYETIPNKSIIAGETRGTEDREPSAAASLGPHRAGSATLGVLARGAPGLSVWRREESAAF